MRCVPSTLIGLMLRPVVSGGVAILRLLAALIAAYTCFRPSVPRWNSMPAYRSSVFSRTTTRLMFW